LLSDRYVVTGQVMLEHEPASDFNRSCAGFVAATARRRRGERRKKLPALRLEGGLWLNDPGSPDGNAHPALFLRFICIVTHLRRRHLYPSVG